VEKDKKQGLKFSKRMEKYLRKMLEQKRWANQLALKEKGKGKKGSFKGHHYKDRNAMKHQTANKEV
jgi:hypothetical protein